VSLERVDGDGDEDGDGRARMADGSVAGPLDTVLDHEREDWVTSLVVALSTPHQLVLHLHYVEGLNFREIGMVMDVSESRATQLHTAALAALGRAARPPLAMTFA
jgi:RNA polymerase sigma factor for flagellar operon FliA